MTPTLNLTRGRKWYGSMESIFNLCRIVVENNNPIFTQRELDGMAFMRDQVVALLWQEMNL